ncbi:SGNH/GDSL hydrolase family protein [Paenibacillus sp. 2RAB27]|uniref:SGNH/GDSL hydrolase family protein n=1 Tax=Paenibacillus sp. 2RAB27 TaxID=3232991 RepID=UPI003F9C5656
MARMKIQDMALSYSGTWTHVFTTNASMDSRHESDGTATANASATWNAYCTSIEIYAMKAPTFGKADIYIDGFLHGEADYYAPTAQYGTLIYPVIELPAGFHTLEIRKKDTRNPSSTGNCISIDYLYSEMVQPQQSQYKSIVCIGDSITFGANVITRPDNLYGRKLQQMLCRPVSIHGLSGADVSTITNVIESVVASRNPDLVLWLTGMNNLNPQASLEIGLDKMKAYLPNADIIMATIQYNTYYTAAQNIVKVNEVKAACAVKRVPCVDMYSPTLGITSFNKEENTVHPSDAGQGVLAALFYQEIIKKFIVPSI